MTRFAVNFTMLVRNRPNLTRQALESLSGTMNCAVTVLNDRSEDETNKVLQHYESRGLHLFHNALGRGTGTLRNIVIYESEHRFGRGDYLYLSDNDVFFHPGWLGELLRCYDAVYPEYAVIGAYNHPYHNPVGAVNFPDGTSVQEVLSLATQSMLMRWEVYDKYGPFGTTPVDRVCMSEDVEFCNRIRADGFKVGVVHPHLVTATAITNTFGEKIPGWELVKAQAPEGIIIE